MEVALEPGLAALLGAASSLLPAHRAFPKLPEWWGRAATCSQFSLHRGNVRANLQFVFLQQQDLGRTGAASKLAKSPKHSLNLCILLVLQTGYFCWELLFPELPSPNDTAPPKAHCSGGL